MEITELDEILGKGEDGRHQFKSNITNAESLAGEMVAFANSKGGIIIIGVDDTGKVIGLTSKDIQRLNQLIANTATNNVKNPINPVTENIKIKDKVIIVVHISEGTDKPYMDNNGIIWVKCGSDKRRVTSKEEIRRMFQDSDLVHADELPVHGTTENDIDFKYFRSFYEREYEQKFEDTGIPLIQLLRNMNLAKGYELNLACLLLFGRIPQKYKPSLIIKAVNFAGNDPAGIQYRDNIDITGNIKSQFESSLAFMKKNLRYTQQGRNFNSLGELEIPKLVLEELIVNAIIHRNYFISSPIKLFIFDNRVEIISPGSLPNNLTIENIKNGISVIRNDILTSFSTKEIPYRGIGTGIRRALKYYADIEFKNDIEGELFTVTICRH
ncbi:MAG: putative DNA binding domain-containing protein [Bacteroidia bacterium]|nr:putative DNA binding domain-containing protein [Bacteroidia bacterium]